ncbi:ATP-grasp domain-containing protein [Paraburkholderia caballeronis]|uniref:ATP-grasp domain-containing protein n=1 Tax=Paraburkholderia caballeronis TaxID=416943 RepID=UPI0010669BF6|nr:ATP-grasp domain-containing protein [Paraburkholderia caballeronis]TDV19527.1 putative ATP-grasp superfamily ATP-dependent carboligase [Paraburkholderia caballeronis]TDV22127.1 putative ATP-grasp superfamily ATP-dependent carboligase [Paraburkholderia caballeronis]TDV29031.1 putative ATP-grasp superfamily ATP-dependent carboligase [Paraburkholderia caballeronis]
MTRIFVYEYLTGGGTDPAQSAATSLADLSALIVEGRVMRDALAADLHALGDGVEVSVARSRFEAPDPARRECVARDGETMTAFVARAAREHDYAWIVAPECDGLLMRMHDAVGSARWLGCTKEAIRVASSKSATAALLAAHGIDATPSVEPGDAPADRAGRWVVKPDDGAGGLDTFVFDRFDHACGEYDARAADGRNPVLQRWVDGEPLSLSLACGDGGATLLSVNRQRIGLSVADPAAFRPAVVEFDGVDVAQIPLASAQGRALDGLAQRVAAVLPGLRGFVGIDLVWHPQRGPVVVEINPRVTVAYAGMSAALGHNVASRLLRMVGARVDGLDAGCAAGCTAGCTAGASS